MPQRCLALKDHQDRLLCPLPLFIQPYEGCKSACAYCSINGLRQFGQAQREVQPCNLKWIEKFFYKPSRSMERKIIDMEIPAQIGTTADPCQPAEKVHKRTLSILKILKDNNSYPSIIVTKYPNQLTEPEYLKVIDGLPLVVQCSISSEDQFMLSRLEPNAPSMKRRFAALETLHDAGVITQLRLWPFIPDLCGSLEHLLAAARDAGISDVLCNFLKVYNAGGCHSRISQAIGHDYLKESYLKYIQSGVFKIAHPDDQIRELQYVQDLCSSLNLNMINGDDWLRSRGWQDCCGVSQYGFNTAPWAYYVRGHVITSHTTYDEYMGPLECPWDKEFRMEYENGKLERSLPEIVFHKEDKSYSRLW